MEAAATDDDVVVYKTPRAKKPLKTYSRRINSDPASKSKLLSDTSSKKPPPKLTITKKAIISDYFKPVLPSPAPTSHTSSRIQSSEPPEERPSARTPPSSPPNSAVAVTSFSRPSRARRKNQFRRRQQTMDRQLYQATIDAGQSNMVRCRECGMHYCTALEQDRAAHSEYHGRQTTFALPKVLTALEGHKKIWSSAGMDEEYKQMVMVDNGNCGDEWTAIGQKLVDHMSQAIGGTAPQFGRLPLSITKRYVLFALVTAGKKVVAAVLCEPIDSGFESEKTEIQFDEFGEVPSIVGGEYKEYDLRPAEMGVSRLWVANGYRGQGQAARLMDAARCHFLPGPSAIHKDRIAYTDLTENGGKFAEKYHADFMCHLTYVEW